MPADSVASPGWRFREQLAGLPKFGSGVGLHRAAALMAPELTSPWGRALDTLKITGSNGKGSVSAMLASALSALGCRTGRITSPHLLAFNERIAVDGQPVSDAELDVAWRDVRARVADWQARRPADTIGAFEAITALALAHLARVQPQALVVEAGIGGRYDPTRVLPGRLCALTSVDLEHTALLGATRELIAYDKADLCAPGGSLIAALADRGLAERLSHYCALRDVRWIDLDETVRIGPPRYDDTGMCFDLEAADWALHELRVALRGPHQARNAALSVLLLRAWWERHAPERAWGEVEAALRAGLMRVRWPGRFEQVAHAPDTYVDVGHTPAALAALAETVRHALPGRRLVLVVGVSADKAAAALLAPLVPMATVIVCTQARQRAVEVTRLLPLVRTLAPSATVTCEPDVGSALAAARAIAQADGAVVLVAGGLFVAAEALAVARGFEPHSLCFF
jgi:dihydrofolate synthase/folylpolyglutamate synthase